MPKLKLRSPGVLALRGAGVLALSGIIGATAATALTVDDYANQRIFQRVGTSKAVPVTGTYTGPASIIQARAVPHGTAIGDTGFPWTTIAVDPTGGTYAGSLTVPQGGWYAIQVRDGVNPAVNAAGTNKWGVGVIVGLIGQSNMQHLRDTPDVYPNGNPLCCNFDGANWDRLGNIADGFPPNTPYATYGSYTRDPGAYVADGIVFFANYLQAALGIPVGTLAYPVSGSVIASWQPGGSGSNWNAFAAAADAAGGDYEAVIWLHGESNAGSSMVTYKAGLDGLLAGCLAETGRSAEAFAFGVVTLGQATTAWTAEGNMGAVRQAQLEWQAATAGTFYAGTALDMSIGDSIHIAAAGLARLGKRYAAGLAQRLAGITHVAKGPVIAAASRAGAVVTVQIAHNGGTALSDGAGGSGGALLGFRVFDAGTPMTIIATAIAGNTVTLTLSANPAGAVTLDYGMTNLPFGSTVDPASVLYDNQVNPGDTLGFPLQPKPLMAVS